MSQSIFITVLKAVRDCPTVVLVGKFATAKYQLIKDGLLECKADLTHALTPSGELVLSE